jgi:serine/threonine-protein kinase
MSFAETCLLGMHVLEPLAFTHQIGIIHQDVKPGNIFLCRGGVVKILDFGLSRKLLADLENSAHGDVVGTPLYIAPEQLTRRRLDCRVDIYAVGVVLHECLLGYPPFRSQNVPDLLHEIESVGVIPIERLRPDTPPSLVAALEKAVNRRTSRRYETATEMYAALETLYRSFGGHVEEGSPKLVRTLPAPPLTADPNRTTGQYRPIFDDDDPSSYRS